MNYTAQDLSDLHIKTFREIAAMYPKRDVVGTKPYMVRTTVGAGSYLVTTYSVKQADGSWNEHEKLTAL